MTSALRDILLSCSSCCRAGASTRLPTPNQIELSSLVQRGATAAAVPQPRCRTRQGKQSKEGQKLLVRSYLKWNSKKSQLAHANFRHHAKCPNFGLVHYRLCRPLAKRPTDWSATAPRGQQGPVF
jgi:hypothetical protein